MAHLIAKLILEDEFQLLEQPTITNASRGRRFQLFRAKILWRTFVRFALGEKRTSLTNIELKIVRTEPKRNNKEYPMFFKTSAKVLHGQPGVDERAKSWFE
jgi:hypothetical protein